MGGTELNPAPHLLTWCSCLVFHRSRCWPAHPAGSVTGRTTPDTERRLRRRVVGSGARRCGIHPARSTIDAYVAHRRDCEPREGAAMTATRTPVNPWSRSLGYGFNQAELVESASRLLVLSGQ